MIKILRHIIILFVYYSRVTVELFYFQSGSQYEQKRSLKFVEHTCTLAANTSHLHLPDVVERFLPQRSVLQFLFL